MRQMALILFVGFELSYYLLIIQTGVTEYLHSDLIRIAPLAFGGILGSFFISFLKNQTKNTITLILLIQLLISYFYPNLSGLMLFILGLSAGAIAPLMLQMLKRASLVGLGASLGLSYSLSTALFNFDVSARGTLALALTALVLLTSRFLPKEAKKSAFQGEHSLLVMSLWIFLDSALFETLSRDTFIPIWRLDMSAEIIFFHLLGIVLALTLKVSQRNREIVTFSLFALSYFLYFTKEALLLAAIYPLVISYYNVLILQTLRQKEFKTISISMIFIAWIASGAGLFVALQNATFIMPIFIIFMLARYIYTTFLKDYQCLNYSS